MRKLAWLLVLTMCLGGCVRITEQPVMETVADEILEPVAAEPKHMAVWLPDGAAAQTMACNTQNLCLCRFTRKGNCNCIAYVILLSENIRAFRKSVSTHCKCLPVLCKH